MHNRRLGTWVRAALLASIVTLIGLSVAGCTTGQGGSAVDTGSTSSSPPGSTSLPALEGSSTTTSTTMAQKAPTKKGAKPRHLSTLSLGDHGPAVLQLQKRLSALGYWLGPPDGVFGDSTQQAVYALQKAAGISRDGIVGPETRRALAAGAVPHPQRASGTLIEVDLETQLLMIIHDGELFATLNTSTGGGYTYSVGHEKAVAITPEGTFHTYREIDGTDVDSLGVLWRPKFFTGGFAIHGDGYVPAYPVSHGCVRVSDEAIDWIWAENLDPIGTEVWVY